jgi:hypothetical protein
LHKRTTVEASHAPCMPQSHRGCILIIWGDTQAPAGRLEVQIRDGGGADRDGCCTVCTGGGMRVATSVLSYVGPGLRYCGFVISFYDIWYDSLDE